MTTPSRSSQRARDSQELTHSSFFVVSVRAFSHNERMDSLATVSVHESQFPDRVRRELLDGLRRRQLNPKFHYESIKQAQKWLALHETLSPAARDPNCVEIYEQLFKATAARVQSHRVHVLGLGCGGGHKDVRLLEHLQAAGKQVFYYPVDVSLPMVLAARNAALKLLSSEQCSPLVCDLAAVHDLSALFPSQVLKAPSKVVTFFGLLPNIEPAQVLPQLARLVTPDDSLLISANLAPGSNYSAGVRRILSQYDNPATRDWLLTLLLDLGFLHSDGRLEFAIEEHPSGNGLLRVAVYFLFARNVEIRLDAASAQFSAGEKLQVFYSYRYTPSLLEHLFRGQGLQVAQIWTTSSGEEGVALARIPAD